MDQFEPCEFFATCLPGVETLLARELEALGVRKVRPLAGGVTFYAKPAGALRVCLWSRLAGRVNCTVGRASTRDAEALYADVRQMAWEDEVGEGATIAVKVSGTNAALRNTQFTALKVKDAVCDRLAEVRGARPDVNPHEPDCLIEVRLRDERATVSVDLSGAALTHRSYLLREDGDDAPLAVAQAAALLASLRAGEALAAGWGLFDAACDDGLLVCEAASAAADQAPGLLRERWGFMGWGRFDEATWDDLLAEADDRLEAGIAALLGSAPSTEALGAAPDQERVRIVGVSASSPAVARARAHLRRAGLRAVASVEAACDGDAAAMEARLAQVVARGANADAEAPALLVASAAPVSHAGDDARAVAETGAFLAAARRAPAGSRFGYVGAEGVEDRFRTAPAQRLSIGRGRAEAVVECFDAPPAEPVVLSVPNPAGGSDLSVEVNDAGAAQFAARLRKVVRERRKWAQREGVHCYRIYDADLPEYAAAIDVYEGAGKAEGALYAHVAEYQAPKSVDEAKARARFEDILALVPVVLGIRPDHVFSKARLRARGGGQYRDAGNRSYVTHTTEDGLTFELDLGGYLDTGLFLDHRVTREMVGKMAAGKTFLNLFAYTGTATVHAAAAGAKATTTVDLSGTYLDWAQRNLEANGFRAQRIDGEGRNNDKGGSAGRSSREAVGREGGRGRDGRFPAARPGQRPAAHQLVRADVTRWIQEARRSNQRYDVIFVDPPTFSNSKAMGKRTWDVQRDHVELLIAVSRLLAPGGVAVFSCNLRTFKPDTEALARYGVQLEDITAQTIPHDFERNPRIHHCYIVRRGEAKAS